MHSVLQVCLMALGHCSQEHYPVLFEELPSLMEEYTRSKQRRGTAARPEEVTTRSHTGGTCPTQRQHCPAAVTRQSWATALPVSACRPPQA